MAPRLGRGGGPEQPALLRRRLEATVRRAHRAWRCRRSVRRLLVLARADTVNENKNVNDQYDYRSFVRFILIRNNQSELKKQVSGEAYLRGMHGAQACV